MVSSSLVYIVSGAEIYTICFEIFISENKPKNGGICVANHTSPIDVIILASDGCYAMVFTPAAVINTHLSPFSCCFGRNALNVFCVFCRFRLARFTAA